VTQRNIDIADLMRCFPSDLPNRFKHAQHSVCAGVRVAKTTTACIHWQFATGRSVALSYEMSTFSVFDKPKTLQAKNGSMDKCVIDHQVINIGM
tara:strand:+ start:698 stop:979 length:282 start_codon:yes stop_codon:yes gene_type:complete